jgi:hypothetical protein
LSIPTELRLSFQLFRARYSSEYPARYSGTRD